MAGFQNIFSFLVITIALHTGSAQYRCLEDHPFSCGCIGDTIRCYGLKSFPIIPRNLKGYLKIQIEDGGVHSLEKSFDHANFTSVTISNMGLKEITDDAFHGLEDSLNTLNLKRNELTTIPKITYLRKLKTLYLSHNKIMHVDANAFANLDNSLQTMDLGTNYLSTVPKAVRTLRALNSLSLPRNQITDIEPDAFEGVGATLRELYLRGNRLTTIPLAMNKLTNLWRLSLSDNQISGFDPAAMMGMENTLYGWHLNNNSLTEMPFVQTVFKELKNLDLGDNKISRIDSDAFLYMPHVNWLWVNNNNISVICPGAFAHMAEVELIRLQFSWNRLRSFPESVFGSLASGEIHEISIENNPIVCDCKLAWLRNSTALRKGVNYPAICAAPRAYKKAEYTMLNFPIEECDDDDDDARVGLTNPAGRQSMFVGCKPPTPRSSLKNLDAANSKSTLILPIKFTLFGVLLLNLL